jgi:hypothetical protein
MRSLLWMLLNPADDARCPLHFHARSRSVFSRRDAVKSRAAHISWTQCQYVTIHHTFSYVRCVVRPKVVHHHVRVPSSYTQSQQVSSVPATTISPGCRAPVRTAAGLNTPPAATCARRPRTQAKRYATVAYAGTVCPGYQYHASC